jgi:hypothetical protein
MDLFKGFWDTVGKTTSSFVDFGKSIFQNEQVNEYVTWNWKTNLVSNQAEKFIGLAVVSYIAIKVFK